MKILCDTTLINRANPLSNGGIRAQKSTLCIGMHPPNKENSELFLLHFTPTNKTGTRYKIIQNIDKVFTKFAAEGKTTISFKEPAHDIQVKSDPIQLKCFLQTLKLAMSGKYQKDKLKLSSISVTPIPSAAHPITKMVIRNRGEFPLKGLPRTLTLLHINGIGRCRVDSQIFFLKNLRILDLSDNCIEKIPKQIGQLQLVDINLSKNHLNLSTEINDWEWFNGSVIQQSLQCLNLSRNSLPFFPYKLVKLKSLITLKLDENEIKKIPFAIRRLKSLRFLHLTNNKLASLPCTISGLQLDTIDISNNSFELFVMRRMSRFVEYKNFTSLCELAARVVSSQRIFYTPQTVPRILIDVIEETPLCPCGLLCFTSKIYEKTHELNLNFNHVISNRNVIVYADSTFCGLKCYDRINRYF